MNEQGRAPDKSCGFTRSAKGESRRGPLIKGNRPRSPHPHPACPGSPTPEPAGARGTKDLALEVLAADPGDQDPERTDQSHDQGWEIEELVDEYSDWRASWHQAAK